MNRSKPPALTSPFKMGFFVFLMLVTVGIGVTAFFMKEYGISYAWRDLNEWKAALDGRGFLVEILPLLALVMVSSVITLLMISHGVRKYQHYLDSGMDYKNLLQSLRQIEDIENKKQIEKLKHHPDLKKFLLRIRESFLEQRQHLDEREKAIEGSVTAAVQSKVEVLSKNFGEQCAKLQEAVQTRAWESFDDAIEPSVPEFKSLAETMRSFQETSGPGGGMASARDESFISDLKRTSALLHERVDEVATEFQENARTAKDIEDQLNKLAAAGDGDSSDGWKKVDKEIKKFLDSVDSVEKLSESLGNLGEEAKGVAISAALQAGSGKGSHADVVGFAEDLKGVAAKFSELSRSFLATVTGIRTSASELEGHFTSWTGAAKKQLQTQTSLGQVSTKTSLWAERLMIFADKMNSLLELKNDSLKTSGIERTDDRPAVTLVKTDEPETPDTVDQTEEAADEKGGFDTIEHREAIFTGTAPSVPELPGLQKSPDTVLKGEKTGDDALFADLSHDRPLTLEEEAQPADEPSEETQSSAATATDTEPNVIDVDTPAEPTGATPSPSEAPSTTPMERAPKEHTPPTVTAETTTASPEVASESPLETMPPPTEAPAATAQENDGAIDLYELGAVDYDPAVHG